METCHSDEHLLQGKRKPPRGGRASGHVRVRSCRADLAAFIIIITDGDAEALIGWRESEPQGGLEQEFLMGSQKKFMALIFTNL